MLGLKIWKQGTAIPEPPAEMTWHTAFSMFRKLVGYFPVCGWLCVIAGVLKRCVTAVTKGWDDPADNAYLRRIMEEVLVRVTHYDSVRGNWSISGEELNAWVDTSSLATSMVLERHGDILEDACWLRLTNINLAELDTTVKGFNLALQWQARTVHMHTDSMYIYQYTDGKSPSKNQSHKQDAGSKKVEDPTATDSWIQPPSRFYFYCIEAELVRWAH